ncbi:MAG: ribonuclease E/G [Geminicoccaceae bacterium]
MSELRLVLERRQDGGVDAAIVEDDRLIDLQRSPSADEVGERLFAARVSRLDRHLAGAFVDIGSAWPEAFILARDARYLGSGREGRKWSAEGQKGRGPSSAALQEGQRLIVQGRREADGDKGPRVTAAIQVRGRYLVYQPHGRELTLSPRIRGRQRDEMSERCARFHSDGGLIVRRLAVDASDDELAGEVQQLSSFWTKAEAGALAKGASTGGIAEPFDEFEILFWHLLDHRFAEIGIADDGLFTRCRKIVELLPEGGQPELVRLAADRPAFAQTGVNAEIEQAFASELPLAGGGRLIIEQTAACVAIDVDGGGRAALDVDIEAAGEIGRQLRLRNLGGTIIVDFVDLPTKPQRQRLDEALRRSVRGDPSPVQIFPMSPLGIVQLSRARRGGSPLDRRTAVCPACSGSGRIAR